MAKKDISGNILRLGESQRKDGSYQYRWIDEQVRVRITCAEDLEALRREITQIHRYLDHGIPTDIMSMTMDELYDLWMSGKRDSLKARTLQRYTGMYENHISLVLGARPAQEIRRADIRRYCEGLFQERGLKERSVRNYYRLIFQIFEYGVREGYLPSNPAKGAYRAGMGRNTESSVRKRKALTLREQKMILEILKETKALRRWRPVIQFMLFTGLRIGEIEALRWEDIDLERHLLYVRHTMGKKLEEQESGQEKDMTVQVSRKRRYRKCLSTPKTSSSEREIPLLAAAEAALKEEKERQEKRKIRCREKVDSYEGYVFLNDDGRLLNDLILNDVLRNVCFQVKQRLPDAFQGLEKVTCHTLRHTFATRLCEAGVQMKVIQDVMGHADIGMTMDLYAESTMEQMKSEICLLGEQE